MSINYTLNKTCAYYNVVIMEFYYVIFLIIIFNSILLSLPIKFIYYFIILTIIFLYNNLNLSIIKN